ncbi:baseplate multidomain protein megatron [Caulobacter mirabilis]|uniref:Host specificity protein n=1 Tax=Caulobacter mirabilis TaxID=69666 RepID=A0A2D2AVW1_9CAUL|nr:glycoside hydrolase TIM-barrel-like domain-containing protein [Caulobacter mirabilis]ATQ42144.1 hypothetical protein CSW64_06800 [Caulobacter mirabilis]
MAQVIFSRVGDAVGGALGAAIGAQIGGVLDGLLISALTPPRRTGPRIRDLALTSTTEGAPMAAVFGRARVAGQLIWAARFRERRVERQVDGGKGGPRATESHYSLSFAVALGEGPIDGLGRVWANGKPMDLDGVTMRLHRGTEDQTPDPLIEAVEGTAPAYRGCAYVVFEDLPLAAYGDRPPQLAFEVFRRPVGETAGLEDRLKSVCLIPGAGEFALATQVVRRQDSLVRTAPENVNNAEGRPDLLVSLDQLQAQLPALEEVVLVVAWFGTSLDAGVCAFRPGVETAGKPTRPFAWRAGGVDRNAAHRISTLEGGGPAYGGTPADEAVVQAIVELRRRGLKVTLYPFVLMDCDGYPWRGRITGGVDDVAALFGGAGPGHFSDDGRTTAYHGPAEDWGWRRMILHHARLATLAGGVDGFLIGSEMVGVTTIRGPARSYPAVEALRGLAADCRAVLGTGTAIGYAADWTEYFGHQPADGSGDVAFHLDPLWADPAIDFVGIDFYPPLADQRGPDAAEIEVAGGEGFDWFYATEADRTAGRRRPITDGAHGEPWVFRPKDLVGWWSNAHHDRPGGVRSPTSTAWVPRGKPIRLIEFGCAAVDKGANAPNAFIDPKSAESRLPPFSNGARDDLAQRRTLEAALAHFAAPPANPVSEVYGGPMVEAMSAWCWDARPFPDFPARAGLWSDGPNWALGHWLNGRVGAAPLGALAQTLAARAGVALDVGDAAGVTTGCVLEGPTRLRDALEPLAACLGFDVAERSGRAALTARDGGVAITLTEDDLARPETGEALAARRTLPAPPDVMVLRFIDETAGYQTGSLTVRRESVDAGGVAGADLPLVMAAPQAEAVGRRLLARAEAARDEATVHLAPLAALRLEAGDRLRLPGYARLWRVERLDLDERPRALLSLCEPPAPAGGSPDWTPGPVIQPPGPPVLHLLDLPLLPGAETDRRLMAAVAAEPWRACDLHAGAAADALTLRGRAGAPANVGVTLSPLPAGPLHRFDRTARLTVRLEGAPPQNRSRAAVLGGANALAVQGAGGDWEILQFLSAEPVAPDVWVLSGLLRGQAGSEPAMAALTPAGAAVVALDDGLVRVETALFERGVPLLWRAAPAGAPPGGEAASETIAVWRGLADRPWAPAHLRRETLADGAVRFRWIRRARIGGDGWEAEPPLGEETERYRIELLVDGAVVRRAETEAPVFAWTPAMQAVDRPGGLPDPVVVRLAQFSSAFGWGAVTVRSLWR